MPTLLDDDVEQQADGPDAGWDTKIPGLDGMGDFDWGAAEKDMQNPLTPGDYDGDNPASKAKRAGLDGDDLKNSEGMAGAGNGLGAGAGGAANGALAGENSALQKAARQSGNDVGKALKDNPGMSRFGQAMTVMRSRRGQTVGISGAIITALIMGIAFFTGGLEAINIKENFVGRGSLNQNFSLRHRRAKTMMSITSKFIKVPPEGLLGDVNKVSSTTMKSALRKSGFEVLEDADGKVTSVATTLSDGTKHALDYTAGNIDDSVSSFVKNIGPEGTLQLEKVSKTVTGFWKSPFTRGMYRSRLMSTLKSWLPGTKSDPTKTPEENAKATVAASEAPETNIPTESGTRSLAEASEVDGNGNPVNDVTDTSKIPDELADFADGAGDPAAAASALDDVAIGTGVEALEAASVDIERGLLKAGVSSLKSGALSAINYTQGLQLGCQARGMLQFIASYQNIILTIEMARFALKYLNAADSQKAGLLTTEGLRLYLSFFAMGRKTGSYSSSPGILYNLGDHKQVVSDSSLSQFSLGRSNSGARAKLANFVNALPGMNSGSTKKTCRLVTNGWFQAGSMVVGTVAAIFTLGSSAEISIGTQAVLVAGAQAALTLAIEIGGPMLARAGKHIVVSEIKDTLSKGDGLGAGLGALRTMTSGANGMLLTPTAKSAALHTAAVEQDKIAQKDRSAFERYLSLKNGDSLLGKLAFSLPRNAPDISKQATSAFASIINPFNSISRINGTAYAASSTQCTDDALENYATDPFCNPEVSIAPDLSIEQTRQLLLKNGHIDSQGKPISEAFKTFINRCASGQPSLVYNTNIDKNGGGDDKISTCTSDEEVLAGETTTAGEAYAYIYDAQPKQSFFAKLLGQPVYAAEDAGRPVSQRERFAAWQGYTVDTAAITEDVAQDFPDNDAANPLEGSTANAQQRPSALNLPNANGKTIDCNGLKGVERVTPVVRKDAVDWSKVPSSGLVANASNGMPINYYVREPCDYTNAKTIVILSSIHGTENQGQPISFDLLTRPLPANLRIIAIPEMNQTGLNRDPGRLNAKNVNLNRNFNYNWVLEDTKNADNNYSGPSPESEPETIGVAKFLAALPADALLIAYHDNLEYVVASSQSSLGVSKAYFDSLVASGVKGMSNVGGQAGGPVVNQHGSADAWYANVLNRKALLIEMKAFTPETELTKHADAIVNLLAAGVL